MKKFTFFVFTLFISSIATIGLSQELLINGGFESWDSDTQPTGWNIAEFIDQESDIVRSGDYSARHTAPGSSNRKLQQVIDDIVPGTSYTLQMHFLDNDPSARMRLWSYWLEDGSIITGDPDEDVLRPTTYSTDSPDWQVYTAEVTAPSNADAFRFEVRIYAQDGSGGGYIYYDDFSFNSDFEVKPEPDNYPTDFAAEAAGFGAALSWTDALGDQLPDAYLIIGEMAVDQRSVPVFPPEDGTPVPDNLDISLGYLAMNVPYGAESYTFDFLEPASGYQFTIYPYTNVGSNIDYKTDGTPPTATVVTNDFTILLLETFDDDLGVMHAVNVIGEQEWQHYVFDNNGYARINGYESGESHLNEDWLISPALNFVSFEQVKLNFRAARNFDGPELKLMVSEDYDGSGDPNDFSWADYTDAADWSTGGYEWVESGDIHLNMQSASVYIAFKYTSTTDAAAVWQVDDVLVYAEEAVGVQNLSSLNASLHPNPVIDQLEVNTTEWAEIKIMDLNGRLLLHRQAPAGKTQIDVSALQAGTYVVVLQNKTGATLVSKMMKMN